MTTKEIRRRTRRTATARPTPSSSKERITNHLINKLQLAMSYVDPATLKPPRRLLRKNSSRQANAISASIRNFGFLSPILVNGEDRIICGHARWLAAKELGLDKVPVISATHLSEVEMRLVALADNKCSSLGEWDEVELGQEFAELGELVMNTEISLDLSAFISCEIDQFRPASSDPTSGSDDDIPPAPAVPVTQAGDLWQLGHHRLLCGDALVEQSYQTLMGSERAQMVFVDPPYNLSARTISGLGKVKHGSFRMASGELSSAQFTEFLETSFGHMARYSIDGAMHFACMDWRHTREMQDAGEAVYSELKNIVVWDKQKGGMGACYRSQHEFIWVWKNGTSKHINNFGLGEGGRYRTNVWSYKGNNSFHRNRAKELATHATVKPLALVADAIRDCSHHSGIILDAFGGSGTTLLAAEHTGRQARLIELEPRFCDATILAWQQRTGCEAVLAATGQTWAEVAQERGIDVTAVAGGDNDDDECEHEDAAALAADEIGEAGEWGDDDDGEDA